MEFIKFSANKNKYPARKITMFFNKKQ